MPVFEFPDEEYLPDDTYNWIVVACEYQLPEGTRRWPRYAVTLRVNDGEFFGKEVKDGFSLTDEPKKNWAWPRFLRAIGCDVGKSFDTDTFDPVELQGRECIAVTKKNARGYTEIDRYLMPDESSMF